MDLTKDLVEPGDWRTVDCVQVLKSDNLMPSNLTILQTSYIRKPNSTLLSCMKYSYIYAFKSDIPKC